MNKDSSHFWSRIVLLTVIALAAVFFVTGCSQGRRGPISGRVYHYNETLNRYPSAYYREVAEEYVNVNPDRAWVKSYIADRTLTEGMTPREVRLSWGEPKRIKRTPGTTRETWHASGRILYFEDGKLRDWDTVRR